MLSFLAVNHGFDRREVGGEPSKNRNSATSKLASEAWGVEHPSLARQASMGTLWIRIFLPLGLARVCFIAKSVANAAHRFDQHVELAEFLSERADVNVDCSFERICIFTTTAVHQFVAAERTPWGVSQGPQQPELRGREYEFFPVSRGDVVRAVNRDAVAFDRVPRLLTTG